jgi:Ca2+-binding RTX toxin-like protein
MAQFLLTTGVDTFTGADNVLDDFFATTFGSLNELDHINGGAGYDFLVMGAEFYNAERLINVRSVEYFSFTSTAAAYLKLSTAIVATSWSADITVQTVGDLELDATAMTADKYLYFRSMAAGHKHNITSGAGNDVFDLQHPLATGSSIHAGSGVDTISLLNGPLGVNVGSNFSSIEIFRLALDSSIRFTAGFAPTNGVVDVVLNAGANLVTVAAGATVALDALCFIGTDTILCSSTVKRNDTFTFDPDSLANTDIINGGGGSGDALVFRSSGTITAAQLAGISAVEQVRFDEGNINHITLASSMFTNVASGQIRVQGNSNTDTINAASFTNTQSLLAEGLAGNDILTGGAGDDVLRGGEGQDVHHGGTGSDFVSYYYDVASNMSLDGSLTRTGAAVGDTFSSIENISGSNTGNDTLAGNSAANRINGNGGNDTLFGRDGDDDLKGGLGNDTMTGGVGADQFIFDTTLNASTNKDTITSLSSIDRIVLDNDIFTALGTSFTTDEFRAINTGTSFATVDATDNIIYLKSTGQLFYDRDGSGTTYARILFADLADNTTLAFGQFLMVE